MSLDGRLAPISELGRGEVQLVRLVAARSEPLGARLAQRELAGLGTSFSEATVSRLFARLDDRGYTRPVGRKGRVMTESGRAVVNAVVRNEYTNSLLEDALDVRQIDQLVDLLHARRGVEGEAATLAAERASEEDLQALRRNVEQYGTLVEEQGADSDRGNDFHRILVKAAHSPLIETMFSAILHERLAALEPVLLVITGGHGGVESAPKEHLAILEALERRDRDTARALLISHLGRLIEEAEDFARRNDGYVFERLLLLAK